MTRRSVYLAALAYAALLAIVIALAVVNVCQGAGWNPRELDARPATPARFVLPEIVDPGARYVFTPENTVPLQQRQRFRNPDGSCVQCSIAIAGVHHNVPAAEYLLWQSRFGRAERGGSWPERVTGYCRERGIAIVNQTGGQTLAIVDASLRSGRAAAIKWGPAHMVTALGITADGRYAVCDNNSTSRIDYYSRDQFARRFADWVVILDGPALCAVYF